VWFINEARGWVIGDGCPAGGVCVFHTRDGGQRWEAAGALATGGRTFRDTEDDYVSDVRFDDSKNGWAFDRGLWSTHDGGATWHAAGLGTPVLSLETAGGMVYALVASCRLRRSECQGPARLYETKVGRDDWRPVLDIDTGSGVGRYGRLVVSGRSVYALVDRSGTSWATARPAALFVRTPGGGWERRMVPPSCFHGVLAPAGQRELFLSCQTGDGAGGSAPHEFYVSRDGGRRWVRLWKQRSSYFKHLVVTEKGRFVADSTEWLRIERTDGTRDDLHFSASGEFSESIMGLNFVTPRQGAVVTVSNDARGWLYLTHDAGRTWEPVRF
jgi:photosystem II stability/assembly factor-like uncharacterized protein